mgnify:CR=1 FL=1
MNTAASTTIPAGPTGTLTPSSTAASTNTTLSIDGMSCGSCVAHVTKALSGIAGLAIRSVSVGTAQVVTTAPAALNAALASLDVAGYPARITQPAAAASPDPAPKMGGCCGGSFPASAGTKPKEAGGTASCCR